MPTDKKTSRWGEKKSTQPDSTGMKKKGDPKRFCWPTNTPPPPTQQSDVVPDPDKARPPNTKAIKKRYNPLFTQELPCPHTSSTVAPLLQL